jgi:hypothetical protein
VTAGRGNGTRAAQEVYEESGIEAERQVYAEYEFERRTTDGTKQDQYLWIKPRIDRIGEGPLRLDKNRAVRGLHPGRPRRVILSHLSFF